MQTRELPVVRTRTCGGGTSRSWRALKRTDAGSSNAKSALLTIAVRMQRSVLHVTAQEARIERPAERIGPCFGYFFSNWSSVLRPSRCDGVYYRSGLNSGFRSMRHRMIVLHRH
jgi:hypothetical protein